MLLQVSHHHREAPGLQCPQSKPWQPAWPGEGWEQARQWGGTPRSLPSSLHTSCGVPHRLWGLQPPQLPGARGQPGGCCPGDPSPVTNGEDWDRLQQEPTVGRFRGGGKSLPSRNHHPKRACHIPRGRVPHCGHLQAVPRPRVRWELHRGAEAQVGKGHPGRGAAGAKLGGEAEGVG